MSAALDYTIEDRHEQTALAVIPASRVPTILAAPGARDILSGLKAEIDGIKSDASTEKGRKALRSMKAKVASSKMDLIRLGKSLTEEWRKSTSAVNAECKIIEEEMDALGARLLDPVIAYENIEKARLQAHEYALTEVEAGMLFAGAPSSAEIEARITELHAAPERDWQEFAQRAKDTFASVDRYLHGKLAVARQREAEAAELERLREEQAERNRLAAIREQAEREAQIAAQAAEQARLAAEAKAAEEAAEAARKAEEQRVAAERAAQAERHRIECEAREAANAAQREQDRIAAEARAAEERAAKAEADRLAAIETARLAAEQAERDRKAAAEKAERDRIAAEERAEKRRLEAVEAERKRVADEKSAEDRANEERAKNRAHRAEVNGEVLADLMKVLKLAQGLVSGGAEAPMEAIAKAIITAIAKREIKHVTIGY